MILGAILVASSVALLGAFLIFGTSSAAFSNEMTPQESDGNLDANGSWTLSWTSNGNVVHQGSMEIEGRTATIDMEVVRPQRRDRVLQECAVSGYVRLTVACDRSQVIGDSEERYDPDTFTFTFFDRNSLRGSVVDEVGTGSELVTATRR
jgi:hypothetical protein